MDYQILKANRLLFVGFATQRIEAMQKEGLDKIKIIEFYQDLLEEMKNEKLFDGVKP